MTKFIVLTQQDEKKVVLNVDRIEAVWANHSGNTTVNMSTRDIHVVETPKEIFDALETFNSRGF